MQIFDILYYKKDARSSRAYPKDAIHISGEEMEEEERIDEEFDYVEEVAGEEMEEEEMVDEELDDVEEVAGEEMEEEEEMVDEELDMSRR